MSVPSSEQRLEQLWAEQVPGLLGYALRRTSSREDAADVVAEVFAVAWRRIDDVPAGDSARPWLFGVARNVLHNHRRGEVRRTQLSLRLMDELRLPAVEPVRSDVGEALAALGERDRELLTLIAWDGLSSAEAGEALGLAPGTVRVRLRRARQKLREQLKHVALQEHVEGEGRPALSPDPRVEVRP